MAVLVSLACLHMVPAHAQSTAPRNAHAALPEVVVSGSRQEQAADELPLSYDVINANTLSNQQSRNLREALENLPNTSVKRSPARFSVGGATASAGRDGNVGINIRGLGGNRVLLMTDGVRMPRSYAFRTTTFDREYLSLELLKRIEVVRGPASALYGSDGMAGLVNFITHEPADFLAVGKGETPKTLGGRIAAGWSGDDNGHTLAGTVAGQASDTLQWMLTATTRGAHAMDNMGTNNEPNLNRTSPNPQDDRDNAVLGKIVLRPHATQRHVFTLEHVQKKSDVDLLSSRNPLPLRGTPAQIAGAIVDEYSSRAMERNRLTWDARFGLGTDWADHVRTVVAYQDAQSRQVGTSVRNTLPLRVRDNSYGESTWQAGVQADKILRSGGWAHKITYGLDHVRSDISNLYTGLAPLPPEVFPLKRFPDTRETTSALYVQDESVHGNWSLTPGLRFDHFSLDVTSQAGFYPPAKQPGQSLSGSALSPKIGVLYRATEQWSVFGQYAAGFRAPDAGQVNGYYENAAEQVIIIPNPDLRPEKSRGVELGVRGRLDRLSLDAAVFGSHYSNLIMDTVLIRGTGTAADPRIFQTINTERARITGFELKGQYDWGRVAGGRLVTPFSYGKARGVNRATGKPINSVDPAQLALGVQYDTAAWGLRLDMRHHAAKTAKDIDSASSVKPPNTQFTVPSATTLDVSAQWRLRKDLRLNFAVHNLTNRKYWLWPDVYGLAASSATNDAYTQPGRSVHVSLVKDF
ncbi:TonB-dependent hemoglobin/transferrin/lactoferrin family receptor [Acidovorax sp. 210-6]|uniref:TonB-dependent hemoglobin/transferrin/lactoferrin family receptor n=1 Tax=Acidovorax sp. 210-6 TaxID=2699468 RepID=UPI00138A26D5|nr:TonB-dependent hemoglobin/transferrin/lactoferrin family receptor [Acidovorax sp. 210-6]NCU66184.1 TonB-dependent hemoglobin/transferrin/lactoferrin family receptor [Acidovorax sp. 210-6]